MTERLWMRACWGLWLTLLAMLPITSMPLVRGLLGSSTVAAPSIVPLILLVLLWLLPFLVRRGKLPAESILLIAFVLAAILSSVASVYTSAPAYKDAPAWRQAAEAFITLGIGISFYLVAATLPRDPDRLQASLRWINYGGALMLLWSLAQAAAWFSANRYPDWMRDFNDLLSLGPLYRQRVSGFALEPSWLAHQLNMLYLPIWLGFSLQRQSAHRLRIGRVTLENILLGVGVVALGLSFSRVGLIAFAAVCSVVFLLLNRWMLRRARAWLLKRAKPGAALLRSSALPVGLALALIIVYIVIIGGGLALLSRSDPRMADLFRLSYWQSGGFVEYANQLQFGERVMYWQAGWNIFEMHPWLGVGLGSAGYYFPQNLPAYAWNLVEVQRLMFHTGELLNIKSLWVRLLAETGLLGFSVFAAWLTALGWLAAWLRNHGHALTRPVGLAALFVLIAMVFEGFSVDSFALPYYWILFGLLSASLRVTDGGTVERE